MAQVEDKQLEDIEFRQDFIEKDSGSPLHLIREKEMEIRGRVLKAKREAEEIVSEARKDAAERVAKAEEDGASLAREREKEIAKEFETEVRQVREESAADLEQMEQTIAKARPKAVDAVVGMVTDV
jgi:vacuolar-type H+-ATPase subunit H